MSRLSILFGAGNAVLAILLGAFAAHAVKDKLSERMLAVFNTAVEYHFYHALGLILLGLLMTQLPASKALTTSMYLMLFGIVVFCGSLYALSISGVTKLGMITPIGGIAFIAAWAFIFIAFFKQSP